MSETPIQRSPMPRNNVERFIALVWTMADMCGVESIPEIKHHIELLSRAADYHLFEKEKGSNQKGRESDRKRRFIIVFKNRFRCAMDYEYPNQILPMDLAMIGHLLDKLVKNHVDGDFYLKWVFETFLVAEPKFNPPNIKFLCSNLCWEKFLYGQKDELKAAADKELRQSEEMDLVGRCRVIIRESSDAGLKEKVVEALKKYRDGHIMFVDFRRIVIELEKANKAPKAEGEA